MNPCSRRRATDAHGDGVGVRAGGGGLNCGLRQVSRGVIVYVPSVVALSSIPFLNALAFSVVVVLSVSEAGKTGDEAFGLLPLVVWRAVAPGVAQ